MKVELFQQVAICKDIPERGLCVGVVATVVELLQHPSGGQNGCVLEVFNAIGQSISVTTAALDDIAPLRADEVLSVRPLGKIVDVGLLDA